MSRMPVSHSRLNAFESCPRYFQAIYLEKTPMVKGFPLLVGGFFHDWAEQYVRHCIKTRVDSDHDHGHKLFEWQWEKRDKHKEFYLLPEFKYQELLDLVQSFLDSHAIPHEAVAGVEMELAFDEEWNPCGWMDPNVYFRAKVDRLDIHKQEDGTFEAHIVDYKTNWNVDAEEVAANSPQLKRYVMCIKQKSGAQKYKVSLDFVRHGIIRTVEIDPEVGEKEKARVLSISNRIQAAIKSKKFEATPGGACSYCPILDTKCPKKNLAEQLRAPIDDSEAIVTMGQMILAEEKAKKMRDRLEAWVSINGPVRSGGVEFGSYPKTTLVFDAQRVLEWMKGHEVGAKFEKLIKVSGTEMKILARKLERKVKKLRDPAAQLALDAIPDPKNVSTTQYKKRKLS